MFQHVKALKKILGVFHFLFLRFEVLFCLRFELFFYRITVEAECVNSFFRFFKSYTKVSHFGSHFEHISFFNICLTFK